MITLKNYCKLLVFEYVMLGLFTLQGLLNQDIFSLSWWLIVGMAQAMGCLFFFWPVQKKYVMPYLIAEAVMLVGLSAIDQEFMFLGFIITSVFAMLLPLWQTYALSFGMWLLIEVILFYRHGIEELFYPGLVFLLGYLSFGYAFYQKNQAEENQARTQRLLDDLRAAHQKLEAYTRQVQELTIVEERNRLARELHDSVKQQAFAASAQIGAARSLLAQNATAAGEHLARAEQLMDEIREELSQLIYQLRPTVLQDKGIVNAVREWGAGWSEQTGIALEVLAPESQRMQIEIEQALFRIIQEGLSNIGRHSQATQAVISIEFSPGKIHLVIRDNGHGFNPAELSLGIGLRSMSERAEQLSGGSIKICSAPGQGTAIDVDCDIYSET